MKMVVMRTNVGGTRVETPWARTQKQSLKHGYYGEHRVDDSHRIHMKSVGMAVFEEGGSNLRVDIPRLDKRWKFTKEQGRAAAAALEKIVVKNASLRYPERTDALTFVGKDLLGAVLGRLENWRQEKHGVLETKKHGKERYRSALEKASYISGAGEWGQE